ncbi:MAG: hypothetical protein COT90_05220 [Candidatus Diapherotrites archaeon CG10_big_fil_rev_8_21_14_0_10_31_34]|nr:MAG: hypothetical protein COT90_05220 [Candidatus Diapherotrites archaeon CG10_big_fil_rev_8_21_14_0_10_31_34]
MNQENEKEKKVVSIVNLAGNIFLFLIKIFIGMLTLSVALIADSLNSLTDIFSSLVAFIAVKISGKKPDEDHPFGHERAESIAGLIIGVLIVVIGFEILKEGIMKLLFGNEVRFGFIAIVVLLITIGLKLFLAYYNKRIAGKTKSMALDALSRDAFADVVTALTAAIGVFGAINGFPFLDPLMALVISVYIMWNGIKTILINTGQLMGKAPPKELIQRISNKAFEVKGVKGVHDIKAQYLGVLVQVEIHVVVDETISIQKAHLIGKNVQYSIESMEEIDRVFIHLDPFKGNYFWDNKK